MSSESTRFDLPHFRAELQKALVARLGQRKYDSWFSTMEVTSADGSGVVLQVASPFTQNWIETRYKDELGESLEEVMGLSPPVSFVVGEEAQDGQAVAAAHNGSPARPPAQEAEQETDTARLNHAYFANNSEIQLNRTYTFDNFISGPSNSLAFAAAKAVADKPAASYNPLFLHGNVGLGKTHLLQAICWEAMNRSGRNLRVLYITSESFVNEFIGAVEKGDLDRFRNRYRNIDILLIDDIHLLANKERTQEEFFHTFNALYNEQKQIVLSSDCQPDEIPTLKERLVSRFKWGLVAEIGTPNFETRLQILRAKARNRNVAIPEAVLYYLAENIDRNIRELEGAVTKVTGYAQLMGRTIDMELARQALGENHREVGRAVTGIDRILDVTCQHFSVRPTDLQGRKRTQSVALPRQVAMYLARRLTPLSLEEVGGHFGGRDHSTVLYAVQKMKARAESDSSFAELLSELEDRIRS